MPSKTNFEKVVELLLVRDFWGLEHLWSTLDDQSKKEIRQDIKYKFETPELTKYFDMTSVYNSVLAKDIFGQSKINFSNQNCEDIKNLSEDDLLMIFSDPNSSSSFVKQFFEKLSEEERENLLKKIKNVNPLVFDVLEKWKNIYNFKTQNNKEEFLKDVHKKAEERADYLSELKHQLQRKKFSKREIKDIILAEAGKK